MEWRRFDIKAFLKASRHWKEDIARLEQEMRDLTYIHAGDDKSGVRSGNISDMTASAALRRLEIASQIEEIRLNEEILDYALKSITKDERDLIEGFFMPKKRKTVFVREYGKQHGLCDVYVYEERNRVLDKMRDIIEEEYYD